MGVLSKLAAVPNLTFVDEAASVPAEVFERELPPLIKPEPQPKPADIEIKRDPHGFIESAVGYNAAGERVTFEFERDGRKTLERIKVR